MAPPRRLSVITLGTRDLGRMRAFYSDGLGWPEVPGSDEFWVGYVLGGAVLSLFPSAELGEEAGSGARPQGGLDRSELFSLGCNVDTRDEVDEVFAAWVTAGASIGAAPVDRSWGGRSGYVLDPEGNAWEIAWAPGAVFGERGEIVSFAGED
jgi:uncharacterized protein